MKTYFGIAALTLTATLTGQAKERPNILWLTYEDTSPHFIGCYGNEQASTPNIDRLAREGVRFDNAYSTSAVSSPSRFCLITGVRTLGMGTGNHRSQYAIPDDIKGFPAYLRKVGYYTSNNVKTDYNIANVKPFVKEAWDESSNKAGWWNRKPGQPFFAVYNSTSSHQSRTMTNPWSEYKELVLDKLPENEVIKPGNLLMPGFYRDSPEMQKHISRVYNSIHLMDKEFGEWLDRLEKEGLKDSTIVFCFSDHGQGISRGKGSALGLGYQVAFVAWFPPMYKHLSPWGDGVITDELVSFEDMAPTVLTLAGIEVPEYMKGRVFMGEKPQPKKQYVFSSLDRTDASSELSRSVTDGHYLYTRVFLPFQPFLRWNMYYDVSDMQKTIRADYRNGLLTPVQSAMLEPRSAEYLYDVKNDCWDMVNLIDNPELKIKAEELRQVLRKKLLEERDAHFIPEYTLKTENKMPVQLASDNSFYPVEKVLDAALLVGQGSGVLNTQLKLMRDKNPFVRYWASIGLFSQRGKLRHIIKDLDKLYRDENYPPAKINLAVTLFNNSDQKKYREAINALLKQEDPELLRITLHLLLTVDPAKQVLIADEVATRLELNKKEKNKEQSQPNELMTLFLHQVKGKQIGRGDQFW